MPIDTRKKPDHFTGTYLTFLNGVNVHTVQIIYNTSQSIASIPEESHTSCGGRGAVERSNFRASPDSNDTTYL